MAFRDRGDFDMDSPYFVPDIVKQFLHFFYRHIRERNIPEIQTMYEVSFAKLSERHYKERPWPKEELIRDVVDQDHVFGLLYKELYYRHLYARCQPTLRERCESWDNYLDLFGLLLHSNVNMQLPVPWLWDMIDEFVYQYQSFHAYKGRLVGKTPEEISLLKQCDKVWNTMEVLNVLQALVDKSGIVAEIAADGGARLAASEGYSADKSNVLRMLGYFSLLGLLRVHCLIGDYNTALRALYPLNLFDKTHLFTPKVAGANINLFFYSGFAYMMLRRYTDAARCYNTVLAYIHRVKQYHQRSAQYEQILKKNEQLYSLLAITVSLCPSASKLLDEAVATQLRERHVDKISKMSRGDLSVYEEMFSYACPKFVTASSPAFENPTVNTFQAAFKTQLGLFLAEVKSCNTLPLLKQYLLLYSSISLSKLANLMEVGEAQLRTALMCLKNKSHIIQYVSGLDMTSGTATSCSDIEFYVDADAETGAETVIVCETVHTRHHVEFLARHISKFEDIIRDLESPASRLAATAY